MAIRVFIQTEKFDGGPAIFRSRLISALKKYDDIKIVTNIQDKFDIELAFIRKVFNHNKPYILRVDGCYYEKQRARGNISLEDAILKAKHLIFQSYFSLKLCKHVLSIDNKIIKEGVDYSVIYNGIDLDYINRIDPSKKVKDGSFVCCAGWRPNKRPISTIRGFMEADIKRHLYMIGGAGLGGGKIDRKYNSKYVHILGEKGSKETISIMKACDYQIHLCHIDSCPNSVIEGISCGLKVLCSNLGGTRELIEGRGVVLEVDKMWKKKYLNATDLDNISALKVAEGIRKIMDLKVGIDASDLNIKNVAKKYRKIIKRIFGG